MRIDIMTDIETLGTNANSTIIQVSAIAFDITTGEYISEFNKVADISKNERPVEVTGSTIQWWLTTNKHLFAELINGGSKSSEEVLRDFRFWLLDVCEGDISVLHLWGNGILFDNKMIQHQLESLGLTYPIHYRNDRDLRTLVDLAGAKLGISEKALKNKFQDNSLVAHNAFDDVKYQINLAVNCYNLLIGGKK